MSRTWNLAQLHYRHASFSIPVSRLRDRIWPWAEERCFVVFQPKKLNTYHKGLHVFSQMLYIFSDFRELCCFVYFIKIFWFIFFLISLGLCCWGESQWSRSTGAAISFAYILIWLVGCLQRNSPIVSSWGDTCHKVTVNYWTTHQSLPLEPVSNLFIGLSPQKRTTRVFKTWPDNHSSCSFD